MKRRQGESGECEHCGCPISPRDTWHPEWKDVGIRWGRLRLAQRQHDEGWAVHEHSEDFSRCWVIGWFERTKEGYDFRSVEMRPWDTDQPAMHFIGYCAKMLKLYFEMTDD